MKRTLRRLTSFVMAIIMIVSVIGVVNVTAASVSSADQIEKSGSLTAYHTLNQGGADMGTTTEPVNSASNESSSVEVSKIIKPTSTENKFDIELNVVTTEKISDLNISADAAVVVVFDASASMLNNVDGTGNLTYDYGKKEWSTDVKEADQRLTAAKAATNTFIKSFAADAGGAKRMVSVVSFNTDSSTVLGWTDAAALDWTGNNVATNAVNGIAIDSNTNVYSGLNRANNLLDTLDTAAGKHIKSVYVVLVTDGAPNTIGTGFNVSSTSSKNAADTAKTVATSIKAKNAVIYTIAFASSSETCYTETVMSGRPGRPSQTNTVTIGEWLSKDIASSTSNYIDAASGEALSIGFTDIVNRIKQLASAWEVTDPMGSKYIVLDEDSIEGSNNVTLNSAKDTITWDIKNDTPIITTSNGVTSYAYQLTYSITLDTAASGFEEGKYYLTNGYTKLDYFFAEEVFDENGELIAGTESPLRTIDFKVPAVKGMLPVLEYTVEHYWLGRDLEKENATLKDSDNLEAKLRETVTVSDKDYSADNYTYSDGQKGFQTIDVAGKVFKLYYAPDTTTVTVNHYYKDTVIDADGNSTTGDYLLKHTKYDGTGATGEPNAKLYAGDDYTIGAEGNLGFIYESPAYTLDAVKDSDGDALAGNTLELGKTGNVINVYYSRTTDKSEASVTVNHIYKTYDYVLNATTGRYEEKLISEVPVVVEQQTSIKLATQSTYSTATTPTTGNEAFSYVSSSSTTSTVTVSGSLATIDLSVGSNDITLVFEKHGVKPSNVSFTVKHIYSKSVTSIVDGEISTAGSFTNQLGSESTITSYAANETYTISQINSYNGESGFVLAAGDVAKLSGTVTDGAVIELHYSKSQVPTSSSLTVIHTYRNWEKYTLSEAEGGDGIKTGIRQVESTVAPKTVNYPSSGVLYYGQNVSVGTVNVDGYTFNADDSDISASGEKVPATGQTINLYYDNVPADERDSASVTIIHHYETELETIVDGDVDTITVANGSYTEATKTGQAGDSWSTTARTTHTYNGTEHSDYVLDTDRSDALNGTMKGTQTINLYYVRTDSDLVEASYNVVYEYYIHEMSFKDGVAGYWGAPTKLETNPTGTPANITNAAAYIGQVKSFTSGAGTFDGKTFIIKGDSDSESNVVIDVNGKTITLKYICQIAKTATTVTVTHHYWTTTYSAGNVAGTPVDNASTPVVYNVFVGESFTANAVETTPFTYTRVENSENITEKTQNSSTHALTITVPANASTIDFHYDYEDKSNVTPATWTIEHWYRTLYWYDDAATKSYTLATPPQSGSSYATLTLTGVPDLKLDEHDNPTYTLDSAWTNNDAALASPYTITLVEGENIIRFFYTNTVPKENTKVKVEHVYRELELYNNPTGTKTLNGSTSTVYTEISDGVWVGNTFVATPVYSYTVGEGGAAVTHNDYVLDSDYTNALSLVLQAEGDAENVITINYLRTTDSTPEEDDNLPVATIFYNLTVNWVDTEGNSLAEQLTSKIQSYTTYTTVQKEIEGYTFKAMADDSDAANGIMNSDKTVTYVYSKDEVKIEENPVPGADGPEPDEPTPPTEPDEGDEVIDVPGEDIPLGDAPATGDNSNLPLFIGLMLASASILAALIGVEIKESRKNKRNSK